MRQVATVSYHMGRDLGLSADAAAARLLAEYRGVRVLGARFTAGLLAVKLLLPELPEGYTVPTLRWLLDIAMRRSAVVFVDELREATSLEILSRVLRRGKDSTNP